MEKLRLLTGFWVYGRIIVVLIEAVFRIGVSFYGK